MHSSHKFFSLPPELPMQNFLSCSTTSPSSALVSISLLFLGKFIDGISIESQRSSKIEIQDGEIAMEYPDEGHLKITGGSLIFWAIFHGLVLQVLLSSCTTLHTHKNIFLYQWIICTFSLAWAVRAIRVVQSLKASRIPRLACVHSANWSRPSSKREHSYDSRFFYYQLHEISSHSRIYEKSICDWTLNR